MPVNLRSKAVRALFLSAAWVVIGFYTVVVVRQYMASRLMNQLDPKALQKAVQLEPWNAETHWKLGRYFLLVAQDSQTALGELKVALARNPHVARYWLDTAAAYQVSGDLEGQRCAVENALVRDPTSANVAWEAANSYLVLNDLTHALALFRVVMKNDPERFEPALVESWRATKNVDTMLGQVVSPEPTSYFALLNLLVKNGEIAAAKLVWDGLVRLRQPFPVRSAFPYFDYLVRTQENDEAVLVWQELLNRKPRLRFAVESSNLVTNGGFEEDFLNGGFDWRYSAIDGVQVSVDHGEYHSGTRSLETRFEGPAVDGIGVFEYLPVHANTNYHFSIYSKAQNLESASGPRIEILDAYSRRSYLVTDDTLGTSGWREQSGDFHTDSDSTLLTVRVVRQPSESLIKGTFWIDDVSLVER